MALMLPAIAAQEAGVYTFDPGEDIAGWKLASDMGVVASEDRHVLRLEASEGHTGLRAHTRLPWTAGLGRRVSLVASARWVGSAGVQRAPRIEVSALDEDRVRLPGSPTSAIFQSVAWQELRQDLILPDKAAYLLVAVQVSPGWVGQLEVDEITLVPTATLSSTTVAVANPGEIPLSGIWRVQRTLVLPPARDSDKPHPDPGLSDAGRAMVAGQDPATGEDRPVPSEWSVYGPGWKDADGEAIYVRTVTVPDAHGTWQLELGTIDDFDTVWINGVQVGSTDASRPGWWTARRIYPVPDGVLRTGDNRLVVRIFDHFGGGGFISASRVMALRRLTP
jgi:hypothetical protein